MLLFKLQQYNGLLSLHQTISACCTAVLQELLPRSPDLQSRLGKPANWACCIAASLQVQQLRHKNA
jgi:hypothetical protein